MFQQRHLTTKPRPRVTHKILDSSPHGFYSWNTYIHVFELLTTNVGGKEISDFLTRDGTAVFLEMYISAPFDPNSVTRPNVYQQVPYNSPIDVCVPRDEI